MVFDVLMPRRIGPLGCVSNLKELFYKGGIDSQEMSYYIVTL